jgi:toxin HigB-1
LKGITRRKLLQIDAATWLETLRVPATGWKRCLRTAWVNTASGSTTAGGSRWRICLVWREGDAYDVEIVDYH